MNTMLTLKTGTHCLVLPLIFQFEFVESFPPDCGLLTEIECAYTKKWCEWDNDDARCQLTTKVNIEAIFVDYFELASNPFWMIMIPCLYFILFLISKKIASNCVMKRYKISKIYYEKCVIYIFEIIGAIPILFKVFYPKFVYDPIFNPSDYQINPLKLTPILYSQLYGCIVFIGGGLTSMYIIEMSFSRTMRNALKMHHCTTILAAIMICICLNQQLSVNLYRAGVSMTLYAVTECHVFYQLLLYRINSYGYPIFHYLSSYLYLFTRVGTSIIFFICWCQWCINDGKFITTNNPFNIGWCYTLWFFLSPISCIILNYAQYSSIKALFYISNKVYLNRAMKEYYFCQSERILELHQIYTTIDDDLSVSEWQMDELQMFIDEYCEIKLKNETGNEVIQFLFDTLILLQSKILYINTDQQNRDHDQYAISPISGNSSNNSNSNSNNNTLGGLMCCELSRIISKPTRRHKTRVRQRSTSGSCNLNLSSKSNFRCKSTSNAASQARTTASAVGIKWETIYYLFEKELIYLSESMTTEEIIRAKIYTLVSHALETFRVMTPQYKHYTFHTHLSPRQRDDHQKKFVKMIEKLHDKAIENILFVTNRKQFSEQQSVINKLDKQKKTLQKYQKNKNNKIDQCWKHFGKWLVKILRCSCIYKDNSKKEIKPRPHKGTAAGDKKERKKLLTKIEKIETSFYQKVGNADKEKNNNSKGKNMSGMKNINVSPSVKKEIVNGGSTTNQVNLDAVPTLHSISGKFMSSSSYDDAHTLSTTPPKNRKNNFDDCGTRQSSELEVNVAPLETNEIDCKVTCNAEVCKKQLTLEMAIIENENKDKHENESDDNSVDANDSRRSSSIQLDKHVKQYFQRLTSHEKIDLQDIGDSDEKEICRLVLPTSMQSNVQQGDNDNDSDHGRHHDDGSDENGILKKIFNADVNENNL